jgi:hypothetical protein
VSLEKKIHCSLELEFRLLPKCVNEGLIILPSDKEKSGACVVWLMLRRSHGSDALAVIAMDVIKHGAIQRIHGINLILRFATSSANKLNI